MEFRHPKHIKLSKKVGDALDLYYPEDDINQVIRDISEGEICEELYAYYQEYGDAAILKFRYALENGWDPLEPDDHHDE
ncbi:MULTISPECIES: hypothetical protein [Lapidilactobacillus]|uniref:Uncharacterized protein n=2 Tax=Lapidilactobacillus TaxID=2767884 RepID=A0ABW1UML3_9LACO|nr:MULTISPECIES: hypothetical protein [Lapidilactobacillus]